MFEYGGFSIPKIRRGKYGSATQGPPDPHQIRCITIHRNDSFEAKPLITVYGSGAGSLTIGDTTVEIKNLTDQLTLDCELQTAYRKIGDGAPENMNSSIYAPCFPVLGKGETAISWTGGITKIDIIPRWWTI